MPCEHIRPVIIKSIAWTLPSNKNRKTGYLMSVKKYTITISDLADICFKENQKMRGELYDRHGILKKMSYIIAVGYIAVNIADAVNR